MNHLTQYRVARLDRHWRRELRACFVRATSLTQARRIGQAVLGGRALSVAEYRPERDPAFAGYVRAVASEGSEGAQ